MSLHRRLLILLAFFSSSTLFSQGGIRWTEATPICDANSNTGFVSLPMTEEYDLDDPQNLQNLEPCTEEYYSFKLHNPAWYTIQATRSTINVDIDIINCVGQGNGEGIQYGLAEIVNGNPEMILCNTEGNTGLHNLSVSGLDIGKTYYLVLDGYALSVCQYSFSNSSGFDNPIITESISNIAINGVPGSISGCKIDGKYNITATNAANNSITNANEYQWDIRSISGGTYDMSFDTTSNILELSDIPVGEYSLAVTPSNACDNSSPSYSFTFTVEENELRLLPEVTICVKDLSGPWDPTTPGYVGGALEGLPKNKSRDTFYVEIPGNNCPVVQLLPLKFVDGSNVIQEGNIIDTTICEGDRVNINNEEFFARASGSLPQYVTFDGACGNTFEVYVTRFFVDGFIKQDPCSSGGTVLSFESFLNNFEDVKEFASYLWYDENGSLVSQNKELQVTSSGFYSLTIQLTKGNNPTCTFDEVDRLFVDVDGLNDLEVECDDPTSSSISIQWNDIQGIDKYAVGVDGRIIAEDLTNPSYTYNEISLGETVNFFVFAIDDDSNCPPLRDSISCQALDCPSVDLVIENVGIPDSSYLSICLDEDPNVLEDVLSFEVTRSGGAGGGRGRWLISTGGFLSSDDEANVIMFDPNTQDPGEYVLSYRYQEGECRYRSENVRYIEIIRQPISTNLRRRGRLDIEDGVCIDDVLRLDYNGRAGSNATAEWGGDITNADVTGDLDAGFEMTFTTPGTKNFTFMVMDDNGCNSLVAPYSIEVGEPLLPQVITCNSTAAGMEFAWPDQDCVEEYQLFVNGRFETRVDNSSYTYTRAVNGNSYTLEVEAVSACGCDEVDFSSATACMHTFDACDEVVVEISIDTDSLVCLSNDFAAVKEVNESVTNQSANGVGAWEVNTGSAAISPEGAFDPVVAGAGVHQIKYIWTEGDCVYADSLRVYVSEQITYGIGFEDPLCFGSSTGMITVDPQGGSGDYSILIDFIAQDSTLNVFPADTGIRTLIILDNITGCDTLLEVMINSGPDSLNLFRDTPYIILDGGAFTQAIDPSFAPLIDSLTWIYNGEVICDELSCGLDFSFEPLESGDLCFTAYYNDCEGYTECAVIEYFPEFKVYLPNVISLSSDATPGNEVFEVFTNDSQAVINRMLIFDRWGNQVYENNSEGSAMLWNPKLNGQSCSLGVYAYIIEITKGDGKLEKKIGSLTIIK